MMSFRPQAGSRYLTRPRLLALLPDEPGCVVWLQAPYGYGKSVLASQWAASREADGWRVIWLAADASEVSRTVATGLGLPAASPWEAVLETLWAEPTVLVLEDLENLEDHEELVPLLRDPRGLLLLASRGPLRTSELPRLLTSGQLTHLQSAELGFTEQEAAALVKDPVLSRQLWQQAGGWPLPLHFAALTGEIPDGQQLLNGLRASLGPDEWQEALLLATIPDLPADAGTADTARLASSGFVQRGTSGFRLHALVAEHIIANHSAEAGRALRQAADRLPRLLYGEALERLGDVAGLSGLLDDCHSQLSRQAPQVVLRWDSLVPEPVSSRRHITAGMANTVLDRHDEAARRFRAGLAKGDLSLADELFGLKGLVWTLAITDPDAAQDVVRRADRLLPKVEPELAGRFLMDAAYVDVMSSDHDAAILKLERALQVLPADSRFRTACHINLALNRWDGNGDYHGRLAAQTSTLKEVWRLYPSDAPGQCRDIAILHLWAGDKATARRYLEEALSGERANPLAGLQVRAALAALDGDAGAFPDLFERALLWKSNETLDFIAMFAIQTSAVAADYYYQHVPEPALATAAYARRLADQGQGLRLIDAVLQRQPERTHRLYLLASRYYLSRDPDDMDRFLAVTNAGARLLPGHVPVEALPADRPELAMRYDINELLVTGWNEAISLRLDELPDLHVDLLGQLNVRFAGRKLELTERPLQLLILLLLGLTREEAADAIWPEADSRRQRNNLGVQLNSLRKALEPWGTSHFLNDDGLQHVQSDYVRLMAAFEKRDSETVLQLYQEPLAPRVTLGWLDEHRSWLRARVLHLLQHAADSEGDDAGRYLARILELDPLNEATLRQLLKHLKERGRHAEARQRFEQFALRLRQETGLDPEASTRALIG